MFYFLRASAMLKHVIDIGCRGGARGSPDWGQHSPTGGYPTIKRPNVYTIALFNPQRTAKL